MAIARAVARAGKRDASDEHDRREQQHRHREQDQHPFEHWG